MGIRDAFKQWRTATKKYQEEKVAEERRAETEKRTKKEQYRQEENARRERDAKKKTEELRVRELEVANKEKERSLNKRNLKTGMLGGVMDTGRRIAKNYDNIERPRHRRSRKRSYNNYSYRPSYQSAPRRKGLDDIDREFDKFF
jgi:hypothetical protein